MAFKAGWAFESGTEEGWQGGAAANATNPRNGAYALRPNNGVTVYAPIGENLNDALVQFGNRQENWSDQLRFGLLYNGTWVAYVYFNTLQQPTLFYNGGAASQGPLTEYVYTFEDYHTIEIELTTIGVAGDVRLRIDGDVIIKVEAVDTRAGGGTITQVNQVGIFNPFTAVCDVDDVVVFDHSGTINNSWPDGVGGTKRSITADGTNEEMTPSTGVDHYALLDEVPPSSADYVQAATGGLIDSFVMQDVTGMISGTFDIVAMQVVHFSHEPNGPSARTVDPLIIVDSVEHQDGVDHELTSSLAFYPGKLWEENPETDAPWSAGELDDIEIGITSGA